MQALHGFFIRMWHIVGKVAIISSGWQSIKQEKQSQQEVAWHWNDLIQPFGDYRWFPHAWSPTPRKELNKMINTCPCLCYRIWIQKCGTDPKMDGWNIRVRERVIINVTKMLLSMKMLSRCAEVQYLSLPMASIRKPGGAFHYKKRDVMIVVLYAQRMDTLSTFHNELANKVKNSSKHRPCHWCIYKDVI